MAKEVINSSSIQKFVKMGDMEGVRATLAGKPAKEIQKVLFDVTGFLGFELDFFDLEAIRRIASEEITKQIS